MRKVWLWLRDVIWLSVLAVVFVVASIVMAITAVNFELATVLALGGVAFSILSSKQ